MDAFSLFFALICFAAHIRLHASQVVNVNAQSKADLSQVDKRLLNSFHVHYHSDIAKEAAQALANGANVNVQDEDGNTILMRAARDSNLDTVELLITTCPHLDIHVANHKGETPIEAAMFGYFEGSVNGLPYAKAKSKIIIERLAILEAIFDSNTLEQDQGWKDRLGINQREWIKKDILDAYQASLEKCEPLKKKQLAYEQEVANNLHEYFIEDLSNIMSEYNRMSALEFVALQKQQALNH